MKNREPGSDTNCWNKMQDRSVDFKKILKHEDHITYEHIA